MSNENPMILRTSENNEIQKQKQENMTKKKY